MPKKRQGLTLSIPFESFSLQYVERKEEKDWDLVIRLEKISDLDKNLKLKNNPRLKISFPFKI